MDPVHRALRVIMPRARASSRASVFLVLLVAAAVAVGFAVARTVTSDTEVAATWLSVPILVVSLATLWTTWPRPARLVVFRADELGLDDLIFYVGAPSTNAERLERPQDYLLQLHVVIANVGERKAVLSRIKIDQFIDADRRIAHLPGGPEEIHGMQWIRSSGYRNGQRFIENSTVSPPYVLERDDVILVQFRQRRGLTWAKNREKELREFWEPISRPLVRADGSYLWRRGDRLVESQFSVPLSVAQQEKFATLMADLTQNFTTQPFSEYWRPELVE